MVRKCFEKQYYEYEVRRMSVEPYCVEFGKNEDDNCFFWTYVVDR